MLKKHALTVTALGFRRTVSFYLDDLLSTNRTDLGECVILPREQGVFAAFPASPAIPMESAQVINL